MANHEVTLKVPHGINIGKLDVDISIDQDGKLLGKLQLSRGGVDFIPSGAQARYVLGWTEFAEVMQEQGHKRKKRIR